MKVTVSTAVDPPAVRSESNRGKLVVAVLLAAAIGAFFYFDLGRYLSLDSLKANRDSLLAFTESHYAASVAIFVAAYCLLVAASLPGAVFFTLAGGFLFGSVLGTVYVNLGATSGATLAFLSARYLLRDWVETKFGSRLAPGDPQYRPRYEGGVHSRDGAYHQGTVWPFLLGPFVTAWIKTHGETAAARRQARAFLNGLERHLAEACLGQVSEIFDAIRHMFRVAALRRPGLWPRSCAH